MGKSEKWAEPTRFEWGMAAPGAFELSLEREALRESAKAARRMGLWHAAFWLAAGAAGALEAALASRGQGGWIPTMAWALGYALALGIALGRSGPSALAGVSAAGAALGWLGMAQAATGGALLAIGPGLEGAMRVGIALAGSLAFAWIFADLHGIWSGERLARAARKLREMEPAGELERAELGRLSGISRRADRYAEEIAAKGRGPTRKEFVELRREALLALRGGEPARPEPIRVTRAQARAEGEAARAAG